MWRCEVQKRSLALRILYARFNDFRAKERTNECHLCAVMCIEKDWLQLDDAAMDLTLMGVKMSIYIVDTTRVYSVLPCCCIINTRIYFVCSLHHIYNKQVKNTKKNNIYFPFNRA